MAKFFKENKVELFCFVLFLASAALQYVAMKEKVDLKKQYHEAVVDQSHYASLINQCQLETKKFCELRAVPVETPK